MESTLTPEIDVNNTFEDNTTSRPFTGIRGLSTCLTINIVISIIIIISNGLVLWTIYRVRIFHTITNMFIVNLAVVDLLTGLVALPVVITTDYAMPLYDVTYTQGKVVCITRTIALTLFYALSVFSLIGISVERYIAIVHPLRYYELMTLTKAKVIIMSIWVYMLAITLIMFIDGVNVHQPDRPCTQQHTLDPSYFMFIKLNLFVPVLVNITVYTKISWVAFKHRAKIVSELASIDNAKAVAYKNEHRILRVTTIVNVIFMIMYGQFMIIASINLNPKSEWSAIIWEISATIVRLNSGINPFIYAFSRKKYKNAFLVALKLKPLEVLME